MTGKSWFNIVRTGGALTPATHVEKSRLDVPSLQDCKSFGYVVDLEKGNRPVR